MSTTFKDQMQKAAEQHIMRGLESIYEMTQYIDSTQFTPDDTYMSYYIDYSEQDIYHAAAILMSMGVNRATKQGHITPDNVIEKTIKFKEAVKEYLNINIDQEAQVDYLIAQANQLINEKK